MKVSDLKALIADKDDNDIIKIVPVLTPPTYTVEVITPQSLQESKRDVVNKAKSEATKLSGE